MYEIKIFEGHNVEVIELNGQVLFNPYNVGECLELTDSAVRMAIAKMNSKQVRKLTNSIVSEVDFRKIHNTGENFLTESGVYKLIFKSHKENAERFQDWVTDEVLPSIRKTGSYNSPDYSALSPQLQFMIQMEQRQNAIETAVQTTNRRIDAMCETMQIRGDNWRTATHSLVNRIATASRQEQRAIYLDIYDELEYRAGCNLSIRLENLRDRLYARGVSQSKIDHLNRIDVIADDKKLTEIYIAIVKEMAVKFDVC